jgi:dolichol-phosphate mannosyltransferase
MSSPAPDGALEVSVVVPVCNEEPNVEKLAGEIGIALAPVVHEIIFVDDGSTDGTAEAARRARAAGLRQLRLLRHSFRSGQSAAVHTGARVARAEWVVTLDGDGQNDPADIPKLLAARNAAGRPALRLVMGNRTQRRDTWRRRLQSRIANAVRSRMLGDNTPDTGCGIKLMHRDTFLALPYFDHMHRFLPALFLRQGAEVISVPVKHRPRAAGSSKYGMFDRLWVGIVDMFGVLWLRHRYRPGLTATED